ncbi:hypothetical protein IMCC26134_05110 [Verrucomicrobia bacterium IMCC26134]|nr:hypothetical protein IMCC26134_05110 [Verrucomicrobia bacterium IMCC26134]
MAEDFIRVRVGLELFAIGKQVLDADGAYDFDEVAIGDELGAVLRDDKRSGIFRAGAGGDGFHPVHHVAAIGVLRLGVHAVIDEILAVLLIRLEAVHDIQIHAVETARHRVVNRGQHDILPFGVPIFDLKFPFQSGFSIPSQAGAAAVRLPLLPHSGRQ